MRKLTESVVLWLALAAACGSDAGTEAAKSPTKELPEDAAVAPSTMPTKTNATAGTPSSAVATPAAGSSSNTTSAAGAAAAQSGGAGAPAATSGSGATGAAGAAGATGAAGAGTEPTSGQAGVPCDVSQALAAACHRCHGTVPANGAPMSLVTLEDFQTLTVGGKPRVPKYQAALNRMNGTKSPPMPPASTPITDEDKQTLIDWLGEGAPAGDTCP